MNLNNTLRVGYSPINLKIGRPVDSLDSLYKKSFKNLKREYFTPKKVIDVFFLISDVRDWF